MRAAITPALWLNPPEENMYELGEFSDEEKQLVISNQTKMLQYFKDEERRRKLATIITIGSALFAAARLGIVGLPWIKTIKWKRAKDGT